MKTNSVKKTFETFFFGAAKILIALVVLLSCNTEKLQVKPMEKELVIESTGGHIHGTLLTPGDSTIKYPLVIIIAGSGPTDRNCNSQMMRSDAYKLLADSLMKKGIASFRYDKRGIGASNDFKMNEADLRFDDFVEDAYFCVTHFSSENKFSKIIIAGHSEGALIGLLASKQGNVAGYISICGAGRPIDVVLKEQLAKQPDEVKKVCYGIIDCLKKGETVKDISADYASLFRESVQPYMISWMKYDPAKEISELKIPALILGGDSDIQVSVADADSLQNANPNATYKIIAGMNHIFRTGFKNREENVAAYNKHDLPIASDLVKAISDFVLGLK